jgi:hypothetical protein
MLLLSFHILEQQYYRIDRPAPFSAVLDPFLIAIRKHLPDDFA